MGFNQLLTRFSTTCKLSSYIDKVIVKGYSDSEHKVVMGMADKIEKVGEGKELVSYASKLKKTETILLDYEINSEEEAKVRAQAELDRRSMAFVKGAGRCIGVPEVVPGAYIEIKDFDETVDNLYYVTKVVHKMTDGNYYTEFEAGANHI
jgi:phage protein D